MHDEMIAVVALAVFFGVAIAVGLLGAGVWTIFCIAIGTWFVVVYGLQERRRRSRVRRRS